MKYAYTILYVEDVKKTINFYKAAFGFTDKFITPEEDYAELITGETTLAFASHQLGAANFSKGFQPSNADELPFGAELAFVTENIEADFAKALQAGAFEYESVKEKPWGQKVGYLRDVNGFLIEMCTPVKQ